MHFSVFTDVCNVITDSKFLIADDTNIFCAVASFSNYNELQSDTIRYKFGVPLTLWLSMLFNREPLNSSGIHLPLNANLEILMLLVRIVLNMFKSGAIC